MKITADLKTATASQSNLAKALGISRQRVSQLLQEDVLEVDEKGNILVINSVINYVKFKGVKMTDDLTNETELDYNVEKAKNERTKRKIAELKLARMEREVYSAKTVELVLTEMLSNLRTQLLGLPTKLAPQLEGLNKGEISDLVTKEIEEKLSELSEYNPVLFVDEIDEELEDE